MAAQPTPPAAGEQAVAATAYGPVAGERTGDVLSFKGIPYAAPPFGELRFQPPSPPEPWTGPRPATAYGPTVPKPPYPAPVDDLLPEPVIPGEDCLNLNVWTPDLSGSRPVMVWVHGGAFVNGSGAVPQYDGTAFARDGVVLVTINYRLGVDGFGALDGVVANRGLLDQVAALEWVRDNIASFGGDPGQVTVFGESAGAMSVTTLMSMPRAHGLFHRAITQSGGGSYVLSEATARRVTEALAKRLGIPATAEAFAQVPVGKLSGEQAALSRQIATMPDPARWGEITLQAMMIEPVVDGDVLPQVPIDAVAAGAAAGVDVLTGTTTDEQLLFLVPSGLIDMINDLLLGMAVAAYGMPPEQTLAMYRGARPGASPGHLLAAVSTDWFFRIPSVRLAEAVAKHGHQAWMYEFAWPSPRFDGRLGACHSLEIPFVFDTLQTEGVAATVGGEPPQRLADEVHGAWVAFATKGNPGWPAYTAPSRTVRVFNEKSTLVDDPRAAERQLWEGHR